MSTPKDFKEGQNLKLKIEKFDISKYYGAFGEGTLDEFKEYESEAQMQDSEAAD